jgi:transcriptional regulator with XRE-family HTH domain
MKKDFKGVLDRIRKKILPEQRIFIRKNLSISQQINTLLQQRGWSQKVFAEKLGKEPSEVSKLLSGFHNLTLQSISKMESVVGEDIIITPLEAKEKYKQIKYVTFKVYAKANENVAVTPEYNEKMALNKNCGYSMVS